LWTKILREPQKRPLRAEGEEELDIRRGSVASVHTNLGLLTQALFDHFSSLGNASARHARERRPPFGKIVDVAVYETFNLLPSLVAQFDNAFRVHHWAAWATKVHPSGTVTTIAGPEIAVLPHCTSPYKIVRDNLGLIS
jgi:hypothetical protein